MLKQWEDLPDFMRVDEVRPYWEILDKKRGQLILKRVFELVVSIILLVILAIPMGIIAILIKKDSEGPVFYRQERVTTYGRHFRIHKFQPMPAQTSAYLSNPAVNSNSHRCTNLVSIAHHRPELVDAEMFTVGSGTFLPIEHWAFRVHIYPHG